MCEETSFTKPGPSSHRRTDDHNSCGGEIVDCPHKQQQVLNYYMRSQGTAPMSAGKVPGPWGSDRSSQPALHPHRSSSAGSCSLLLFLSFLVKESPYQPAAKVEVMLWQQAGRQLMLSVARPNAQVCSCGTRTDRPGRTEGRAFRGQILCPFLDQHHALRLDLGVRAPYRLCPAQAACKNPGVKFSY